VKKEGVPGCGRSNTGKYEEGKRLTAVNVREGEKNFKERNGTSWTGSPLIKKKGPGKYVPKQFQKRKKKKSGKVRPHNGKP